MISSLNKIETKNKQLILDLTTIKNISNLIKVNWSLYLDKKDKCWVRHIKYPVTQKELDRICAIIPNHLFNTMGDLYIQ